MSADPEQLARGILAGDRRALARGITLLESSRDADREPGDQLLERLVPHSGRSIRVGISGVPGVGKSTFIESFGIHAINQGHRVAVLAVDPSSALSGGSILGDKTRMSTLSASLDAFIRPSPAGGTLGGVARNTRETMILVEAAGFDVVLVETVGVGQSETAVAEMTDFFMLMLLPGGGDELQGIKRGIIELADLVVVNKADGDLTAAAGRAAAEYRNALGFLHPRHRDWQVQVLTCSATQQQGINGIWSAMTEFRDQMTASGTLERARSVHAQRWLWDEISENLMELLREDPHMNSRVQELEQAVAQGKSPPRVAAREVLNLFTNAREGKE
ncbi:MAG: methylmalonyl Co-A mutase-associated GTPase MeaB [Xanthomonadales bacterium]|nr:methylmalonyl Co-A mutase-associated GTPase MeaB [Xanthomonadales bacterium]